MGKNVIFFIVGMALFILALALKAEGILKTGIAEILMFIGLAIVIVPLFKLVYGSLKK
ncbi:hypothetical protein [Myroides guanonis]|uniref:Uncharacterized protein n=1 Tax=Myroides guanonis TaxID=1150112 RepID=A0A1I3TN83_9FLAO|nr:hypothetical protein [Myroides guanonis]SFJ72012.1 hypothetical protein SAMN04487893_11435 [Myroides guanonis]